MAAQKIQRTARRTKYGGIDETMILTTRHDAAILANGAIAFGVFSFFDADTHAGKSSSKDKFLKEPEINTQNKSSWGKGGPRAHTHQ